MTSRDEDFAESFATFAYDVKVKPGMQAKMDFFAAIPELAQFRENFRNSGLARVPEPETGCDGVPHQHDSAPNTACNGHRSPVVECGPTWFERRWFPCIHA